MLPTAIMEELQSEFLNWQGLGFSVMEVSHRHSLFLDLLADTESRLRDLLNIPTEYKVLFLSGSARIQFAMIPMNLLTDDMTAGYWISGLWSKSAYEEAKTIKSVYPMDSFSPRHDVILPNTRYIYCVPNETVDGIRLGTLPQYENTYWVADMTSSLLTEPIDVQQYGLIFAGTQKNIAPAGLTIVIIRESILLSQLEHLPKVLSYEAHIKANSVLTTLPTWNCYVANKVLQWMQRENGVETLYKRNCQKAELLYQYLDQSSHYNAKVQGESRSIVNICFEMVDKTLESRFVKAAEANGLYGLAGHKTVGGLRASLYNAMPIEGVEALIAFMDNFVSEPCA